MSTPVVPQRPARTQNATLAPTNPSNIPQVPPRPARPGSAHRELTSRSPLNDPPSLSPNSIYGISSNGYDEQSTQAPQRPSVASLPLIGQEGEEYASLDHVPQLKDDDGDRPGIPDDTRLVSGDLPLHAPKASVPRNSTQSRVPTVVRTDPSKTDHDDDDMSLHRTNTRSRVRPASSGLSREITRSESRPGSVLEEEKQGIPHIGQYVPLLFNAGDVQAPSPAPFGASTTSLVGHDGSRPPTGDGHRRSAQGFHGPPGSYGLHGHGVMRQDQFEKAWYQRHPEELAKEAKGAYGPHAAIPRGEWALSSEELNKLVREDNERGFGTSDEAISVPSEAIGYKASEEYSSRMNSPSLRPVKSHTESQHVESPLRRASLPGDSGMESDNMHLDSLAHRADKYTGMGYDPTTRDLGPEGGNTVQKGGYIYELGRGIPILASDEVQKRPGSEFLQPAVSPEAERTGDGEYYSESDSSLPAWQKRRSRASSSTGSGTPRRTSRPSSGRFHHEMETTGTPLNEIDEYEPLFNNDDEVIGRRPLTAADKLKRPDLERQRFPSQDIWEDTPNSLQLQTTVSGPQEPEDVAAAKARSAAEQSRSLETLEHEQKRRGEIMEEERPSFLESPRKGFAKPKFNQGVAEEVSRPNLRHRFPSQDIWEDTPDSAYLETTLDPEDTKLRSPTEDVVPAASNLAQGSAGAARLEQPAVPARPTRTKQTEPVVPSRPVGRGGEISPPKKGPSIPDRPKPSVPPRPARGMADDGAGSALNRVTSGSSTGSVEGTSPSDQSANKWKPPVPSRPAQGSKLASIKADFITNLNSKLQLGPKKPVPEPQPEAEEEKAPLSDARKGRARGPARRTPAAAASTSTSSSDANWGISTPTSLWHVSGAGLNVHSTEAPTAVRSTPSDLGEPPTASPLSTNTAGETLQAPDEAPKTMPGSLPQGEDVSEDAHAQEEPTNAPGQVEEDPVAAPTEEPSMVSEGVQTGEIKMSSAMGGDSQTESTTAYIDGGKTEGSTVIVKPDGEESVSGGQ